MAEEENIEISNQTSDQKNEKRKKKKRRMKTSSAENKDDQINLQPETVLPSISSVLTGDGQTSLPIDDPRIKISGSNIGEEQDIQQEKAKLRKRNVKKEQREKENMEDKKDDINNYMNPNSQITKSINEQITYTPKEIPYEKLNEDQIDENEKKILRGNMNKFFKRANVVEDEKKGKTNEDNIGTIPSKEIDPNKLFILDEDDGELDYLEGQKAYDLSVFLESHKFIKNIKNFDKTFVELVKRKIIRFEKNLLDIKNDKFFILYELQVSEQTNLCLTDIATLNAVKSIFLSYPSVHLIIFISDEEFYNKNSMKYDYSLIKEFAINKLINILIYLNLDPQNEKRIHAIPAKKFKINNKEFENEKNQLKQLVNKKWLRKLFNLTTKEEEKNDSLLDYPCYLAAAANPSIYKDYIPEITEEYKCLIINSIYYMNRYQLCFDASKVLSFNEPAVIALKIVPPLKGVNGREALSEIDEENTILSSDEKISLNKKLTDLAYSPTDGNNKNLDIFCQYLAFLEEDNDNYNDMIKRYEEGKIDSSEVKNKVYDLIYNMFHIFEEKDINDFDIEHIMIK